MIPRFNIEGFFCGPRATVECVLTEMARMEGPQRGEVDAPFGFKDEKWLALGEAEAAFGVDGQGELYQKLVKLESRLPKNRQHFIGVKTAEEFYEKCLTYAKDKIGPEDIAKLVKMVAADAATLCHPSNARKENDEVFERFASLCKILAPFEPRTIQESITSLFLAGSTPVSSAYSLVAYNLYADAGFAKDFSFYTQIITKGLNATLVDQGIRDFLKSDLDADQKRELLYTALQSSSQGIRYDAARQLAKINDPKALRTLYQMFQNSDLGFAQRGDVLAAIDKLWSSPLEPEQHRANVHFVLSELVEGTDVELRGQLRDLLIKHKSPATEEIVRVAYTDYMKIGHGFAAELKFILQEIGNEETREFIAEVMDAYGPKGFKNTGFQSGGGIGTSVLAYGADPKVHFYAEVNALEVTHVFRKTRDDNWMVRNALDLRLGTDHDDGIGQVVRLRSGILTEFGGFDLSYGVNHRAQLYLGLHFNFIDHHRAGIPGIGVGLETVLPTGRDGADDPLVLSANLVFRWAIPYWWNLHN